MVEEYTRGDQVVLVPNPHYGKLGEDGKPLPYLDKVTVKYVPESNSRVLGLRNGDFDVIDNVPFNEGKALDARIPNSPSGRTRSTSSITCTQTTRTRR